MCVRNGCSSLEPFGEARHCHPRSRKDLVPGGRAHGLWTLRTRWQRRLPPAPPPRLARLRRPLAGTSGTAAAPPPRAPRRSRWRPRPAFLLVPGKPAPGWEFCSRLVRGQLCAPLALGHLLCLLALLQLRLLPWGTLHRHAGGSASCWPRGPWECSGGSGLEGARGCRSPAPQRLWLVKTRLASGAAHCAVVL